METFERKSTTWGPILIFIAAMLWATDAPFRYHLTQGLNASFIVLAEHAINVVLILPFIVREWDEIKRLNWRQWLSILVIGIGASAVASVLFTKAFWYVNPSVAIVLQKLQPLIVIALAAGFLKEKLGRRFWLWALLALAGAYVISFPSLRPELYTGEAWNPNMKGVLLALGAAALWGLGTVLGRYLLAPENSVGVRLPESDRGLTPTEPAISFQTVTALRFLIAFLFLLAWRGNAALHTIGALTGKDILFLIIVAITSGFTSLFIYYKGLENTKASIATLAELGFPFLAVIVNAAALGFFFKPMQVVGMLLLLLAVWGLSRVNSSVIPAKTRT